MTEQTIHHENGIDLEILSDTVNSLKEDPSLAQCRFHIHNRWISGGHSRTTVQSFYGAGREIEHKQSFTLDCGEPPVLAGGDEGPNPVEHLLNALAGCLTGALVYHAALRGIHIEELESDVEGEIDLQGFTGLSSRVRKGYKKIRVTFRVKTDLKNLERLKELSKFSPVFDTVSNGTEVEIQVIRK